MKKAYVVLILCLSCGLLAAAELQLSVDMEHPVLRAGPRQTTFLKVGLTGFEWKKDAERPPLNVALVLDRSGSMDGEKLERAKDAAKMAVGFLSTRDVLSIVTYESEVDVLLPATRVTDRRRIMRVIDGIESDGNTALFAGVSKGAHELRKFLDRGRVNRVILLSDGLANVGPDSTDDLVDLGSALRREGISVTTIGLGLDYNEDLMSGLAQASDGNHAFVREPADLARIFDLEFKDAFEVVAKDVELIITCSPGIRPIRILNREGDIDGNEIRLNLNNVYSLQDRYFLIEVEMPAMRDGQSLSVADVRARYLNMLSSKSIEVSGRAQARASENDKTVLANRNKDVVEKVAVQKSVLANQEAVKLRDKGQSKEAKALLQSTAAELEGLADDLNSPALRAESAQNTADAADIESDGAWQEKRKSMVDEQYSTKNQQRY